MKKLLYQFDTDAHPSVFDNVVGYDGGADHISAYGGVNCRQRRRLGGRRNFYALAARQEKYCDIHRRFESCRRAKRVLAATRAKFFAKFRVSVMFDCNGSNTTAAAAVAWLAHGRSLRGKRAVVLAGSGPVGQRAAVLLAREGAQVAITGRKLGGGPRPLATPSRRALESKCRPSKRPPALNAGAALQDAQIALATGASGITLLEAKDWQENTSLELIADANASPPAGIEGVASSDRGILRHGKILFGALGFGALKLALHRACVARLFEQNDLLLDAEEIYGIAKEMVGT